MTDIRTLLADTLRRFESLGDNCEFGLVQRLAGIEPLGLLRLTFTPMTGLLAGLADHFNALTAPDDFLIERDPNDEVMLFCRHYGMRTHTRIFGQHDDEAKILVGQVRHVGILRRKLLEDLALGEKIWVRKGDGSATLNQARILLASLRRHGPNRLLWVLPQDEAHPAGSVEVIEEGLLCGRVSRFAPYDRAHDLCLDDWLELVTGARLLTLIEAAPGELRLPDQKHVPGNLIPQSGSFGGPWWCRQGVAQWERGVSDVPPPHPGAEVAVHTLTAGTDGSSAAIFGRYVPQGLAGGASHVVSAFVFVPEDFAGSIVGLICDGFESVHLVNVNLLQRNRWQRAWVQTRVPGHMSAANPSLFVVGEAGSRIYTCCWKLELGLTPTEWRPDPAFQDPGETTPPEAHAAAHG